jgi:hypothetical protein
MNAEKPSSRFCNGVLIYLFGIGASLAAVMSPSWGESMSAVGPGEKSIDAPNGMKIVVKMIGPVTQTTDLQIICVLKHDPAPGGDKYIEAMAELNDKLGGVLSSLRDRGEFIGEAGETLLLKPPANSITPKRLLLIGVGPDSTLNLDTFGLVARIAARESTRVGASHVSFAPTLRDQGSIRIGVGDGDAAFVEQLVLAYDTERRLGEQALAPKAELTEFTIEAGPKYFDDAFGGVQKAVASAVKQIGQRNQSPYSAGLKK